MWTIIKLFNLLTCVCIYTLSGAKVNQCGSNCDVCTNINGVLGCTKCKTGYWLSGSSCQPCSTNCATCTNSSSCETCRPGFYLPNYNCNSQCSVQCVDGLCDENTGHCNQCPSNRYGYYCDFECGLCKNEQCELRHCTDGCKTGYWQNRDRNISDCRPCPTNCSSCNYGSICDVCNDGTYLYVIGDHRVYCSPCDSNCETCSTYSLCSSCKPGYYGLACEHICTTWIPYCYLCDWDGAATVTCIQCDIGYTLQDNECIHNLQQCPLNCERCTTSNVCELCKTGWYGELCDKSCRNISKCVVCQAMNDSVLCSICVEGYTSVNGECMETTTKPTSTVRADCRDIPYCSSCGKVNNSIVCSVCGEGYELMNGGCRRISSQQTTKSSTPMNTKIDFNDVKECATCSEANSSITCSECMEGYTTKEGSSSVDICGQCALQSSCTRFQASTFVIGLVTGIGITIFVLTLIGAISYITRRKCFKHRKKSTYRSQNDPFYENSPTANESDIEHEHGGIRQENSLRMDTLEGHSSNVYEGMDPVPGGGEIASVIHSQTSTDKDQHMYSSLGAQQGDHLYKGNVNGRNLQHPILT